MVCRGSSARAKSAFNGFQRNNYRKPVLQTLLFTSVIVIPISLCPQKTYLQDRPREAGGGQEPGQLLPDRLQRTGRSRDL